MPNWPPSDLTPWTSVQELLVNFKSAGFFDHKLVLGGPRNRSSLVVVRVNYSINHSLKISAYMFIVVTLCQFGSKHVQ